MQYFDNTFADLAHGRTTWHQRQSTVLPAGCRSASGVGCGLQLSRHQQYVLGIQGVCLGSPHFDAAVGGEAVVSSPGTVSRQQSESGFDLGHRSGRTGSHFPSASRSSLRLATSHFIDTRRTIPERLQPDGCWADLEPLLPSRVSVYKCATVCRCWIRAGSGDSRAAQARCVEHDRPRRL